MKTAKILRYNVIFKAESEGGFTVIVPSLSGCVTYGENLPKARLMAHDAIQGYLASLSKHGEHIVTDANDFMATIDVARPASKKAVYA